MTIIKVDFANIRQNENKNDKFSLGGGGAMKIEKTKNKIGKILVNAAKSTAKMEANTTCAFLGYQAKEPVSVKKLRKR